MNDEPASLRDTFVAAYPEYVAALLSDRGIEIDSVIADGIVVGTGVLDGLLTSLESTPMGVVSNSPLELFREALRPVDHALDMSGIEPPLIDAQQRKLLPWDRYALSPGSSQPLGPRAHEAHLRWGVMKARTHVSQPRAGLRCADTDAPRLLEQLNAMGFRVLRLPTDEAVSVGIVDIDAAGVDEIVSDLATAGARIIVFGEDPDDLQQIRFKALGATSVVPKQSLMDDLEAHLPVIA